MPVELNDTTPLSAAHTPGPWFDKENLREPHLTVCGPSGETLATIMEVEGGYEVAEANARLMAASHALLAACEIALRLESAIDPEAWHASTAIPAAFRQIKAAIAIATAAPPLPAGLTDEEFLVPPMVSGPKPRDKLREQQLARAVEENVSRCGPVNG